MSSVEHAVDGAPAPPAEVVLSAEQLAVQRVREPYRRVRVSRRVVTENRTIDVVVRREELVVEDDPALTDSGEAADDAAGDAAGGDAAGGAGGTRVAASGGPLVITLREEVPEVVLQIRDYERVTVHVDVVPGDFAVEETLRHEVADVQ